MQDKNKILSKVSMYHAFNDGVVLVIPSLFPIFKEMFNLSYTQVGTITSLGMLVTLFTQLFIGRISDRRNRATLLSLGVLFMSVSLLLLTKTQGFFTLLLFFLLIRFSAGFYHPTGISWISKIFEKEKVDWAMGIQSAVGDFGAFVAIFSTLFIVELTDWSIPLFIWAIAGIFCLFIGMGLTNNIDKEYLRISIIEKQRFLKLLTKELSSLNNIKMFIPGFIISGAAWGIIITYLPLLLVEKTQLTLSIIGIIISIWIGIGTITCLIYNKIQRLAGRKNVIIISYLIMGLMGFCLATFTNTLILILIMIILGISTFLTYPALFSFISDLSDKEVIGATFAYTFTLQFIGGTSLIFISGLTSDIWGIWTPFIILGIVSILVGINLVIDFKKLKK